MNSGLRQKLQSVLGESLRDSQGNILPLAAAAMLLSAALVGSGIDISRAYRVQNRLQSACDAGVLAGRRAITKYGFDSTARTKANAFFHTNFNNGVMDAHDTTFVPGTEDDGATVEGTATTTVDTVVMELFGFDDFTLNVDCQASMGMGNADVMMVLDTTGSMGTALGSGTRISALQDAMKSFYDTVALSTRSSNARIRYGFVPYSSSVNVGRLLMAQDTDYIADTWSYPSRTAIMKEVDVTQFDHWSSPTNTQDAPVTGSPSTGAWVFLDNVSYGSKSNGCPTTPPKLPTNIAWANNGAATSTSVTTINGSGQQVVTTTVVQQQKQTIFQCRKPSGYSNYYVQYHEDFRDITTKYYAISNPVNVTVKQKQFDKWEYRQVSHPTNVFKTFVSTSLPIGDVPKNGTQVTNITSTWNGCIQERGSAPVSSVSWNSLTGISPSGLQDLDLDSEPSPSVSGSQWGPLWPQVIFERRDSSYRDTLSSTYVSGPFTGVTTVAKENLGYNQNDSKTYNVSLSSAFGCPVPAQLFDEMDESSFDAYADSLRATGSTYLDLGMIWGGRLASPDGIFSDNVNVDPDNGAEVARHIIFMTDGFMEPSNMIQSSYGVEWFERRITADGTTNQAARHSSRFRAICSAIKAKGIRIWVIAFTSSLSTDLKNCASDESSYLAGDADELEEAFQEIAKNVGELRMIN